MGKRLTDTAKWSDAFLRGLPPSYKLLWIYLWDECTYAGIWPVDFDVARVKVAVDVDCAQALEWFGARIIVVDGGNKWFIPDYIDFHYDGFRKSAKGGKKENNLRAPVLAELSRYGLIDEGGIRGLKGALEGLTSPMQGGNNNINYNNNNIRVTINEDIVSNVNSNDSGELAPSEEPPSPLQGACEAKTKKIVYTDISLLPVADCLEVIVSGKWGVEKFSLFRANWRMEHDDGLRVLREWGEAFNRDLQSRLIQTKHLRDYQEHWNNWMKLNYNNQADPKNLHNGNKGGSKTDGNSTTARKDGATIDDLEKLKRVRQDDRPERTEFAPAEVVK